MILVEVLLSPPLHFLISKKTKLFIGEDGDISKLIADISTPKQNSWLYQIQNDVLKKQSLN